MFSTFILNPAVRNCWPHLQKWKPRLISYVKQKGLRKRKKNPSFQLKSFFFFLTHFPFGSENHGCVRGNIEQIYGFPIVMTALNCHWRIHIYCSNPCLAGPLHAPFQGSFLSGFILPAAISALLTWSIFFFKWTVSHLTIKPSYYTYFNYKFVYVNLPFT